MTTSDINWVRQRLPGDVAFEGQSVPEAIAAALADNQVSEGGSMVADRYGALADLWERIDSEMLYKFASLNGAFAVNGPLALQKAEYWRQLSDSGTARGQVQFLPVRLLPRPVLGLGAEFADFPIVNPADHTRDWTGSNLDGWDWGI